MSSVRVVQLSDTHFSTPGRVPYGGAGYDPLETYERVLEQIALRPAADLTIVTGDLADHGEPAEYDVVAQQLSRLHGEVLVLPGNHDDRVHFDARMSTGRLRRQRTQLVGDWLFVLADSNGEWAGVDDDGRLVEGDPERDKGILDEHELAWLRGVVASTDRPHVFIWVHHPPGDISGFSRADYIAQLDAVVRDFPEIRGFGCGHAHTDITTSTGSVPVYICPSLTTSIDFEAHTTMPPGYREYVFAPDGTITTEAVLLDDPQWNERLDLPEAVIAWLMDEIDADELKRRLGIS